MWTLTSHHFDRVIGGKSQKRRVVALLPDKLKAIVDDEASAIGVFGKKMVN
jgi:hypothetical protein